MADVMSLRDKHAGERFYVGRRSGRTEVYVVTRRDVEPLPHAMRDEDAAFGWSRDPGPGGMELASAILRDATGWEPLESVCARFHADVIASLPHAGFVLSRDDVVLCLAADLHDATTRRSSLAAGGRRRIAGLLPALSFVWMPMTIRWTYLRGGGRVGGS
jgi:hypothetical protein